MATSGSFAGNSVTYGCYMFVNWQLASQDVANNRSLINFQAYFHFQGADTRLDNGGLWSNAGTHWANGGRVYNYAGNFSTRDLTLATGSFWVNHYADGAGELQFGLGITTQFSPTRSEGTSGVWSLPTIPRHAVLNSAPNFNDEQNPTFNWSNPAGTAVDFYLETPSVGGSAVAPRTLGSGGGGNTTLTLSDAERNTLRSRMPNSNTMTVRFVIHDTLGGVHNWSYLDRTLTLVNGNPVFLDYDYRDKNSTTSTITGDDQYLIQGYSVLELKVLEADKATPIKYATMTKYNASISSLNEDITYVSSGDITEELGVVGASGSVPLTVKAIDSRTNFTSVVKNLPVLPYVAPQITATAQRVNNFETETDFHIEATISRLTISGTDKNTVNTSSGVRYRYKKTTDVSWSSWVNKTSSTTAGAVSVTDFSLVTELDRNYAWNIQVEVTDKLATSTVDLLLPVGIPIFRIGLDGNIYNNEVRMLTEDDLLANNPYKFSAYRSSSQSLTDASTATIICNTEDFDTNNNYNTTTGQYTVPVTGYYQLNASVILHGSTGTSYLWQALLELQVNGTGVDSSHLYVYDQGRFTFASLRVAGLFYLTAGQTVRIRAMADANAGTPNANNYGAKATRFNGFLVAKA